MGYAKNVHTNPEGSTWLFLLNLSTLKQRVVDFVLYLQRSSSYDSDFVELRGPVAGVYLCNVCVGTEIIDLYHPTAELHICATENF